VDGGANAWPGAGGTARTLTFSNNLTFPGNGQMTFSLARTNTIGGGTNDLIDVVGTLSLAGSNSFAVNLLDGQLASGETYTVLKYGSIAGGASNLTYAPVTTRYTFAPDDSVPGEIRLMVSGGGPSAITWRGDGLANAWNVAGSSNWFNGAATDQFFQFDTVTFDDSGSNSPSVNLTDTLTPAAVTVNASKSYTFAGGGKLSGATSLTKLGTGTLTLNNANDFSGAITVGGGVLKPANISALGATNPVGVQSGGTLDLNALNLSPHSIAVQGSGSSGSGAIINSSGASQLNALQFVALTGDATFGGTGRWDIRANPNGALAGNGFKLSKMGANEVWLVGLGTTGLGDVEVRQGLLGIQSSTTLGNSANALALWPNATLVFFDNTTNVLNKVLRATNAIVRNDSANNVFLGPITLNNSNFFNVAASLDLRGPIGGSGTMAKAGSGTLVLRGTNDFSGSLYLDTGSTGASDGMVRLVGPKPLTSAASIILRNNNGGSSTLQLDGSPGSITITSLFRINCRNNTTPAIQNVAGNNTLGGPIQIDVGGTTVLYLCDSGQLTFGGTQQYVGSLTGGRTYTFGGSGNHVINGSILNSVNGAPISVAKTGSGTMTLNVASTYASTTSITQGVVQVNATGAFGTSAITCNSGGNTARIVLSNGVSIANHITAITVNPGVALGLLMVNDNTTATFSGRLTFNAAASSGGHVAGPTTSGVLNLNGVINSGAGYPLIVRLGNVRFAGGGSYPEIQPRANITSLGANNGIAMNALMDIAGNGSPTTPTAFDLNGFNQTLAGLKNAVNAGNAAWVTNSGATTNTLTLNLGATNQSFGGSIVGRIALTLNSGTQTLTKSGPALNGLYTFNGNTTINGGTLVLGAGMTLPNTPLITLGPGATLDVSASGLTLGPGQRIAGNGSVAGNFIANGTVSPGTSIGALTFNNNLSLAGATLIEITHTGPTNDVVNVTATLTRGGVLTVTNIGPALAAGDSFKLFNAGLLAGSFGSMTLPSLGSGLRWNTNQFPANSTISVYAVASPQITPSLNGTNLVLQFPTEIGVNYVLQSTTNLIAPTIWTSQQTNAGNGSIVSVQVPINAAESQKYFRLLVY
jgi:autotransporter-associated beta strand protein